MLKKKKYRVIGKLPIFENKPGKVFEASIPRDQEQRLIKAGHIEITRKVKEDGETANS